MVCAQIGRNIRLLYLYSCSPSLIFLLFSCWLPSTLAQDKTADNQQQYHALSQRLNQLSSTIYNSFYAKQPQDQGQAFDDSQSLLNYVQQRAKAGQATDHASAIAQIRSNLDLLSSDPTAIKPIISYLLRRNDIATVDALRQEALDYDDTFSIASIHLQLAQYHQARQNWPAMQSYLSVDFSELLSEEADHAAVLHGIALQKLKKHRLAIKEYEKVKSGSPFYLYAQLNIAKAFIRQGWWTDAHRIIKALIARYDDKRNEDTDRLFLVMAYSLLEREYYRDAREAFRNVGLDSRYKSKALLGLGIAAASQQDFIGALNAFTLLQDDSASQDDMNNMEKTNRQLAVDESYLLLPHIYKKLGQESTASAGYSNAIQYYQNKIEIATKLLIQTPSATQLATLAIQNNKGIKYHKLYSASVNAIAYEYREIQNLLSLVRTAKLSEKFSSQLMRLEQQYQQLLTQQHKQSLRNYIDIISSYQNQCRYGLARLYDKNKTDTDNGTTTDTQNTGSL